MLAKLKWGLAAPKLGGALSATALALLAIFIATPAGAIDRSWDGGGTSSSWFDNANWDPDGNAGGDDLSIGDLPVAEDAQTVVDQNAAIASLSISGGASAEVPNGVLLTVNGTTTLDSGELKLDAGGSVRFRGPTDIGDATSFANNAPGTTIVVDALVEIGDASVSIGEDFNWDGNTSNNPSSTVVGPAGDLRFNVENIDRFTSDTFDGNLTLNSGSVSVNVSDGRWIMNGNLILNSTAINEAVLAGNPVDFGDGGANELSDGARVVVTGEGTSRLDSQVAIQFNSRLEVDQGASLLTGDIHLDGAIQFTLDEGVVPSGGETFTIIDAEGVVSGFFKDWELPELGVGLFWDIQYTASSVTLVVTNDLPGDYNNDDFVNALDYATWREGLGSTFSSADYARWRNSFGQFSPDGVGLAQAVPEPACAVLCLFGGLLLATRRTSRAR